MNLWKQINIFSLFMLLLYMKCSWVTAKSLQTQKMRLLYYRNVTYNFNPTHIKSIDFITTDGGQGMQINFTPAHNITKDIWMEWAVLIKPLNADTFQNILKFSLNACALMKRSYGPGGFDIVKKWVGNFLNSGSVPISCPVLKNNYSWKISPTKKYGIHVLQLEGFYRSILNLYLKRSKRIEHFLNTSSLMELMYK